jgi:hypothetical protein
MVHLILLSSAFANFGQTTLSSGEPEFADCIDNDNCKTNFYQFLTHSMLEQGFTIESRSLLSNPALTKQDGFLLGTSISTFPFSPPQKNLSGKEENTSFSPVFPRFHLHNKKTERTSYGFSVLPPIPIQGASALFTSFHYNYLFTTNNTINIDGSLAHIKAPITASEDQFENKDSFDDPNNLNDDTYQERCGQDGGCLDQYNILHFSSKWTHSWDFDKAYKPYSQIGLTFLYQRLYVMYDDTTWNIISLQPVVSGGIAFDKSPFFGTLGVHMAPQFPRQHRDGTFGLFYSVETQLGFYFSRQDT